MQLADGDIINFMGKDLEYDNKIFYEVKKIGSKPFQPIWERTGGEYEPNYLNEVAKVGGW